MAAYAALVSIMNDMVRIWSHPSLSTSFDENQMDSLLQRLQFLLGYIESESYNSYGGEDLERQIVSAVNAVGEATESQVVRQILCTEEGSKLLDQILSNHNLLNISSFSMDNIIRECNRSTGERSKLLVELQLKDWKILRTIEDLDSIMEKVTKLKEERGCEAELPEPSRPSPASSSKPLTAGMSTMVGFDGYFTRVLDELVGHQSDRQIITIVGMGGIGKTTLAKNAYDDLLVMHHFDVCAWVTVSEGYDVKRILLETLSCLKESNNEMDGKDELGLGEQLYKTLSGRRYLVVLDDMWSIEAWDKIKFYFPNNCNRSRILVTTRISDVANHFGSAVLALSFLGYDQSWELFCDKVFGQEVCPPKLEEIGRKIVEKCKGLPLSIVVIGGLLGSSPRTRDRWEYVERSIRSVLEDNGCFKLLSLSYSHLPARLKPCFLYLAIFPEDDVIRVSRLIKLWVAEGFIKPNRHQSLEEIAEGYIQELVGRNLISVHSLNWNGKLKTCCIHDLLRNLCINLAEKEKFLCVSTVLNLPRGVNSQRHFVIPRSSVPHCFLERFFLPTPIPNSLADYLSSKGHPRLPFENEELLGCFQQVNLRFLARGCTHFLGSRGNIHQLPPSISMLWNLQTLIMTGRFCRAYAPSEIWKMPQLRHLKFKSLLLPRPPSDGFALHNLQTLGRLEKFRFSKMACKRMPNIKKLSVCYSDLKEERKMRSYDHYCLGNLVYFKKLEVLKFKYYQRPQQNGFLQSLKFPISLKKLLLEHCQLEWSEFTLIGSLPHLQVLKLMLTRGGPSWDPVEGQFLRLKYLDIRSCFDLTYWNADNTHFPVLEGLTFEWARRLSEIPSGIGDIPSLRLICLIDCSTSAAFSAAKILGEQESLGNQDLQVKVRFNRTLGFERPCEVQEFIERVEEEGLTSTNLHLET